ncbi:hypothetical protein CEXT_609961 [Caerostris extrusa]|uniref:Uncharacterized protein n=1 Tax=Caerostris extrusa TaxID=172846 RepID=A0AAV4WAX0_CAEEX|nr:hypothetical protein CEXT_609961 [Caerostris extrusa]
MRMQALPVGWASQHKGCFRNMHLRELWAFCACLPQDILIFNASMIMLSFGRQLALRIQPFFGTVCFVKVADNGIALAWDRIDGQRNVELAEMHLVYGAAKSNVHIALERAKISDKKERFADDVVRKEIASLELSMKHKESKGIIESIHCGIPWRSSIHPKQSILHPKGTANKTCIFYDCTFSPCMAWGCTQGKKGRKKE